jgi:KUP system potassium uptake protein
VLPALVRNYMGQGAFALHQIAMSDGQAGENRDWFFLMTPSVLRVPMVLLATAATGDRQPGRDHGRLLAHQPGDPARAICPIDRPADVGDPGREIYIPQINLLLLVGVIFLVSLFHTSSAMAHAYGLAVTGTMVVTTVLGLHRGHPEVALAALGRRGAGRTATGDRHRLPGRERAQGCCPAATCR